MKDQERDPKPHGNPWIGVLAFFLAVLLILSGFTLYERYTGYAEARSELADAERERVNQADTYQELQNKANQVDSPFQMEQIARNSLGMVKPGETTYRLSPELSATSEIPTPTTPSATVSQRTGLPGLLDQAWQAIVDFFRSLAR